jgi:tetratricopeptide (TPR) repeat protein
MTSIRPNLPKLLAPLAAFALTLAVVMWFGGGRDVDLPGAATGTGVVEIPPAASAAERIAVLQRAARDADAGPAVLASLGQAYLQRARETGDPSFYSRAGRSFDAALRRDARNVDAILGAGTLAGLRHDFDEQLRRGLEGKRLAPSLVAVLPVIADAQIELGRYGAAERTLQQLLDIKPNLTSYSRVSYLRELTGDLPGAVEAMRLAVSAGGGDAENIAYVRVLLGDLELQRGRAAAARFAYTAALRSLPGYPAGTVGLARADAASGDLGRAAARLRRASARLPLTATLSLLAQVERARGDRAAADASLAAARAQQRLYTAAATLPDAETVLFEADHGDPRRAVELGRQVWERAPNTRSADALAWAYVRAGDADNGVTWARRALRTGSRDPLFNLHAGVALERAGRPEAAERHLEIARRGRAALSPATAALLEEGTR